MLVILLGGMSISSYAQEYRKQDNVQWLKHRLSSVCVKQMQIIADAMMKYHGKNGEFPSKPSDLKGYITSPPYNNGRIAYYIFISPSDTTEFDDKGDGWDFVDKHGSYILNAKADIDNWQDILISEKKPFLWPNKKSYVFVGGHGATIDEKSLKKLQSKMK